MLKLIMRNKILLGALAVAFGLIFRKFGKSFLRKFIP